MTMHSNAIIGAIIKNARLVQNRSQMEVSHGICVPSYLSKIENASVFADKEILNKLYQKLDIRYIEDQNLYNTIKILIDKAYYNLLYGLDNSDLYQQLCAYEDYLVYSIFAVDWLLIKGTFNQLDENLKYLMTNMNDIQRSYYYLLFVAENPINIENLSKMQKAASTINNSFAYNQLCLIYFNLGYYSKIHELENQIIAMALNEGNTYQMAIYYQINGSAYACFNDETMMMINYNRALHLLQNTNWNNHLKDINYNIGATYISLGKYTLALDYLYQANIENIKTLQKIALTYLKLNNLNQAKNIYQKIEKLKLNDSNDQVLDDIVNQIIAVKLKGDYLKQDHYHHLIDNLYTELKNNYHLGYIYFYKDMIIEDFTYLRKYKIALDFQSYISLKMTNNTI